LTTLNANIPRFYCFLRKEFLYDGLAHRGEFLNACVFGVASINGRALAFHVLTDNGTVTWRLPLHAFVHKLDAPAVLLDWLQFWDCFSYDITCTVFDRLQESRVRVQMKDGSWEGGQYMFTLDWYGQMPKKPESEDTRARTELRWTTVSSPHSPITASSGFALRSLHRFPRSRII
jgi:hypothetical protein